MNHSEIVSFLWGVADLIRDTFRRGRYQDVILPLTVLRRLDCVLAPTKARVLETQGRFKGKLENLDPQLRKASSFAFYNTSRYDFEKLLADAPHLAANLRNYIASFSPNMREVLERFGLNLSPEHQLTLGRMMSRLDGDAALDASARANTREDVRLAFDQKVEEAIQEIVETNFELYKRITDDDAFGEAVKNFLFEQYLRAHRRID
jgi:type I restriction enzyme M protein